jgi:anti-sigma regulatory factor (Ser/Thr protein kinase)
MRATRSFPAKVGSVRTARGFAAGCLGEVSPEVCEDAVLVVSELVTNCVRHAAANFTVVVETRGGRLRVEVSDSGGGWPVVRHPGSSEPTGRGLQIVHALSDEWGVDHGRGRTTVWFTMRTSSRRDGVGQRSRSASSRTRGRSARSS